MRTKLLFFTMLASVAASAQRTTPVTITNTKVDYATKIVTFDLSWKGSDATHRDEVWVFVDIQPVTGANTLGSWSPATLVPGSTTITAGSGNQYSSLTHTVVSGNTRGVLVKGTATNPPRTFAATVKVTLASGTPAKFNACAYATDYPPNAKITSGSYTSGTYTLNGTKPFVINGTITVNANTYSVESITSITDPTQCPGYRCSLRDESVGDIGCCTGLTAIGGGTYGVSGYTYTTTAVCRDLSADAAINTCGIEFESQMRGTGTWNTANTTCTNQGWRLPTESELRCTHDAGLWPSPTPANGPGCDHWYDRTCYRSGCYGTYNGRNCLDNPGCSTVAYWRCVR